MHGLAHYKLDASSKKVELVKRIDGTALGLNDALHYVMDVSLNFINQGIILILDAEKGLVKITLSEGEEVKG